LTEDGLGVAGIAIAEDVRVAADEFFAGVLRGVLEGEGATFGGQVSVENDLEKEVAEFLTQIGVIGFGDGVDRFTGFLEETGAEGLMGLFAIPRAAFG
jgi:hypothetical protein